MDREEDKAGKIVPRPCSCRCQVVAGAAKTVFGILFKAFDIYFGMFLGLREKYERPIEDTCHEFSFKTVKEYKVPTYAIWFAKPKEEKKVGEEHIAPACWRMPKDKYNEGKKEVLTDFAGVEEKTPAAGREGVNADVYEILGTGPSPTKGRSGKGQGKIDQEKEKEEEKPQSKEEAAKTKPMLTPADELCIKAFNSVIGHEACPRGTRAATRGGSLRPPVATSRGGCRPAR